jgi:hypothetical protein
MCAVCGCRRVEAWRVKRMMGERGKRVLSWGAASNPFRTGIDRSRIIRWGLISLAS